MKRLRIFLFVLIIALSLTAILAIGATAEEKTITISFIKEHDPSSTSTTLDKVANADGKITVAVGEKFTLPTLADTGYHTDGVYNEGYELVWYTANGKTYKAGEEVSFDEDTRLFRAAAKQVTTFNELVSALQNNSYVAILQNDITGITSNIGVKGEGQSVMILNGFNITSTISSDYAMGAQRSGKHVIGEGTFTVNVSDASKVGKNYVFNCNSHSHNGNKNKTTIGVDVTLNAPDFHLLYDRDGAVSSGYPLVNIYGKINVYSLGKIESTTNRKPTYNIYESASVTVTGPRLFFDTSSSYQNHQSFQLNIYGGSFTLPENGNTIYFWTNDYYLEGVSENKCTELTLTNKDAIKIYGGTFNVKLPDGVMSLPEKSLAFDDEAKTYYIMNIPACMDGAHKYEAQEFYINEEPTCTKIGTVYQRCNCGAFYVDSVDAFGHDYSDERILVPATGSSVGTKEYGCIRCDDAYTVIYTYNPIEEKITLVVKTENGTKEIETQVGKIFKMSEFDEGFSLTGVLDTVVVSDTESYAKTDIVKLYVPVGFTKVLSSAFDGCTSLEEIEIKDGANLTFLTGAFNSCPALTKLILGKSDIVFSSKTIANDGANCPMLSVIDATNANVTFEASAFENNKSIQKVLMSAGHSYNYGTSAFKRSALTEVIFPDGATISWGTGAFQESISISYIYIGAGIGVTRINDDAAVFDGLSNLEKLVIMDLKYIGKYAFSTKDPGAEYGPLKNLIVYIHSESFSSQPHAQSFNGRKGDYKVYIYSATQITNVLSNCNYVIYNGIPHAYIANDSSATCTLPGTSGYSIDCPCGVATNGATYTVKAYSGYTGDTTGGTIELTVNEEALGHSFIENEEYIVGSTSASCIANATITYRCERCDETKTVEQQGTATGHTLGEWVIELDATCMEDGSKIQSCTSCKSVANSERIPATGHNVENVEWTTIKDATCSVGATQIKYCSVCGEIAQTQITDPVGHTPSGEWITEVEITCTTNGRRYQLCTICNAIAVEETQAYGHSYGDAEIILEATYDREGTLRYNCLRCEHYYDEIYNLDPMDAPVTIIVKLPDGSTKNLKLHLRDVCSVTFDGSEGTFAGILGTIIVSDTESYAKTALVKIVLPKGITTIAKNAFTGLTSLEEIEIASTTTLTFATGAFDSCPALTKLTLGEGNYIFSSKTIANNGNNCPLFAVIDATKANVTFNANAFDSNKNIKKVLMSAGHSYTFNTKAFYASEITEVVFPDNATITLSSGSNASIFQSCKSLEYVYFGYNTIADKKIPSGACWFDATVGLKKLILMDITYIGKWNFSLADSTKRVNKLIVYSHSSDISIEAEAFNTKGGGEEIHFYTNDLDLANIGGNTNHVIYRGIPHAYTAEPSEPTCTLPGSSGYTIDCPCGQMASATYDVVAYSGYTGETKGTITVTDPIPPLGHNFTYEESTIVSRADATCTKNATVTYKCTRCDETETKEIENTAGHISDGTGTVTKEPTCVEEGTKDTVCAVCGNEFVEILDVVEHNIDIEKGAQVVSMKYPNGFDKQGIIGVECIVCKQEIKTDVEPMFVAMGYSTNENTDALNGGYSVKIHLLSLYKKLNEKITYGIIIANANTFETTEFFVNNIINNKKAIQVEFDSLYNNFNCSIHFGANSSRTLEFIICAYVIDENENATFIQAENDYAVETEIGSQSFTKVTLDLVVENVVSRPSKPDAILPSNDEE